MSSEESNSLIKMKLTDQHPDFSYFSLLKMVSLLNIFADIISFLEKNSLKFFKKVRKCVNSINKKTKVNCQFEMRFTLLTRCVRKFL